MPLVSEKEKNKPKWEDKEGSIKIQLFINKNKAGTKYAIYRIWRYRFPFKQFNGVLDMNTPELHRLRDLLNRLPEIEIKQTKKKKKEVEKE